MRRRRPRSGQRRNTAGPRMERTVGGDRRRQSRRSLRQRVCRGFGPPRAPARPPRRRFGRHRHSDRPRRNGTHDRRRARNGFPRTALLYGRGFGRTLLPRLRLHRRRNPAAAPRRGRPHGPAGRIHHTGVPRRKDGSRAGRSGGRSDRLLLPHRPCAGLGPDAGRLLLGAPCVARPARGADVAARTGAGLLRGGRGVRRPDRTAGDDAPDRRRNRGPAQLLLAGQCPQTGRGRGDRRSPQCREIDPAEPPAGRGTRHGLGDRGHHARRHRGDDGHRRRTVPLHRHGGHPRDRRPARTHGDRTDPRRRRAGADRHPHDRCGVDGRRRVPVRYALPASQRIPAGTGRRSDDRSISGGNAGRRPANGCIRRTARSGPHSGHIKHDGHDKLGACGRRGIRSRCGGDPGHDRRKACGGQD